MSTGNPAGRLVPTGPRTVSHARPTRAPWATFAALAGAILLLLAGAILLLPAGAIASSGSIHAAAAGDETSLPEIPDEIAPAALEWAATLAAQRGDLAEARSLWALSFARDPTRWSPAWRLAGSYGVRQPIQAAVWLRRAFEAARGAFRHHYAVAVNGLVWLIEAFLLAALVLGLLWALRSLPLVHHGFEEILRRSLPGSAARLGAGLILALPLVSGLGFLAALAIPLVMGAWHFRRIPFRGCLLLGTGCFLSPVVLAGVARLVAPADPVHPVALVEQAQRDPGDPHLRRILDESQEQRPGDPLLRFARSRSAWENGELDLADADLAFLEARGGLDRVKILVNRAALSLARNDPDLAIRRLWAARRLDPHRASVAYNLALAHADRLEMDRAEEELRRAQELDPSRFREADLSRSRSGHARPMREDLARGELWRAALGTPWPVPWIPVPAGFALLYPAGNPWLLWPWLVAVTLAALLAGARIRGLRVRSCSRCGRPVCRRCVVRLGFRGMCSPCAAAPERRERGWDPGTILSRHLPGGSIGGHAHIVSVLMGLLVPGSPQIHQGRHLRGFLCLLAAAAVAILIVQGGFPFPGLAGGDLPGTADGAPVHPFWPAAVFVALGLASARDAHLLHRRRREMAVWIGADARRAA